MVNFSDQKLPPSPVLAEIQPILPELKKTAEEALPLETPTVDKSEVRKRKLHAAQALNQACENYKELSPFNKKESLLELPAIAFQKFTYWIRGKKMPPLSDLKLRFAMHLFRNFDKVILENPDQKPGEALNLDLPFSFVLKNWITLLNKRGDGDLKPQDLAKCAKYQKEIEKARDVSVYRRQHMINALSKKIQADIKNLQGDQVLYLPGGALTKGLGKPSMVQMIYTVSRDPNDASQIIFKVFNYSATFAKTEKNEGKKEENHPMGDLKDLVPDVLGKTGEVIDATTEYKLSEDDLLKKVTDLITVQTVSHRIQTKGFFGKIAYLVKQGQKMIAQTRSKEKPQGSPIGLVTEDFSGSILKSIFASYIPTKKVSETEAKTLKVKTKAHTNAEKLFEVFYKNFGSDAAKTQKLLMKTAIFLDLYDKYLEKLSIPSHRKWFKDNAIQLLKTIQKQVVDEGDEEIKKTLQPVLQKFQQIVTHLDQLDKEAELAPPLPPEKQHKASFVFSTPLALAAKLKSMQSFKATSPTSAPRIDPLKPIDFAKVSPAEAKTAMKKWMQQCDELSKKRKIDQLEYLLNDAFNALKAASEANFWENIPIHDAAEWSEAIQRLGLFAAQVHFGKRRKAVMPHQIVNLLQSMEICQTLAYRNNAVTHFAEYSFDMEQMQNILRDPYLNLGKDGPKIVRLMDRIEGKNKKKVQLTLPEKERKADATYFEGLVAANPSLKGKPYQSDFGKEHLLPDQIVHMRKLRIAMFMMMGRYKNLTYPGAMNKIGMIIGSAIKMVRTKKKDAFAEFQVQGQMERLDNMLDSKKPFGDFTSKKIDIISHTLPSLESHDHILFDEADKLEILPMGLGHIEYNKLLPSLYQETEQPVSDPEVQKRVVEGCVADVNGKHVNDNGSYDISISTIWHYRPTGKTQTERKIIEERAKLAGIPSDLFAELQLMQTDPNTTRIPNTLGVFARHVGFFTHPKIGKQLQRVFALNLFRNAALYRLLLNKPEYSTVLVKTLSHMMNNMQASKNIPGMLFLMKIFRDTHHVMEEAFKDNTHPLLKSNLEKLQGACHEQAEIVKRWRASSGKDEVLRKQAVWIHHEFLMNQADDIIPKLQDLNYNPLNDSKVGLDGLKEIFISCYFSRHLHKDPKDINPSQEEQIRFMMHRLSPFIAEAMKDEKKRNEWIKPLLPSEIRDQNLQWKAAKAFPCFESGKWRIDVLEGLIFENKIAKCPLPSEITSNKQCRQLFGENEIYSITANHSYRKFGKEIGRLYEFTTNKNKYRIVVTEEGEPQIYKLMPKKTFIGKKTEWYQLQQTSTPTSKDLASPEPKKSSETSIASLGKEVKQTTEEIKVQLSGTLDSFQSTTPYVMHGGFCWISSSGKNFVIEDSQGKTNYIGQLSKSLPSFWKKMAGNIAKPLRTVAKLIEIRDGKKINVLDPWKFKDLQRFCGIANPSEMILTGQKQKVESVRYPAFELEYTWEPSNQHWQCKSHQGFFLSKKKIDEILATGSAEEKIEPFFSSFFTQYQIIEHLKKPSRLLLAGEEYEARTQSNVAEGLEKYRRKELNPKRVNGIHPKLYSYDIDPIKGLKASSPEAYLYLAYVLYTQSKYAQASFYLRKAADLNVKASPEIGNILSWFSNHKTASPKALAVNLQLDLIQMQQEILHNKTPFASNQKLLDQALNNFQKYQLLVDTGRIPIQMQISEQQRNELQQYFQQADYDIDKLVEAEKKLGIRDSAIQKIQSLLKTTVNALISKRISHEEKVKNEIQVLEKKLEKSDATASKVNPIAKTNFPICETPLFPQANELFQTASDAAGENQALKSKLETFRNHFNELTSDNYIQESKQELIRDTDQALANRESSSRLIKADVNLSSIEQHLVSNSVSLLQQSNQHKKEILNALSIPKLPEDAWKSLVETLKESDLMRTKFFEEVLFCYAACDWTPLIDQKIITSEQIPKLEEKIEQFLEITTLYQQSQKALDLIEQHKHSPSETTRILLSEQLNLKRFYDLRQDPYRRAILLLEYDSKLIAKKSQIDNVRDMLNGENLFKHEALAGGKTTVLRNIISKIKANGATLAGVITHEPLIEMHHTLLQSTTRHAYGEQAFHLDFNRGDPTNAATLRNILNNFLHSITEHGRIDLTKKDALNLHHACVVKYEEIRKNTDPTVLKKLNEELDILNQILDLLLEKGRIGSDELDKVCDAEKEHNFAYGPKVPLNEVKVDAALELAQWTLRDPEFGSVFASNNQYRLDPAQREKYRLRMAEIVHHNYLPTADKDLVIAYLTGITVPGQKYSDEQIKNFFENVIQKHPNKNTLKAFHKYFHVAIPGAWNKQGGVRFARSEDDILVKPCERNGKCDEKSEHGTEEETIWYTCLNYVDQSQGGVSEQQIAQYVLEAQDKAAKKVVEQHNFDPDNPIRYQDTPSAKKFQEDFGQDLQQISSADYRVIANRLNNDPKLLAAFLKNRVLSQVVLTEEKITGNSSDLVNMFQEFYGSSGTSNNFRTLPDKIVKHPELVKQPGVDGAVLLSLTKDFEEGDIIFCKQDQDVTTTLAGLMQKEKGAGLIDLGPAFPGMTGIEISQTLAKQLPGATQVRFVDNDEQVKMLNATGEITQVSQNDSPENFYTVFDQAHTRGTDLLMANQSIGYVTIGPNTNFSDFLQAVMRMRKLGKGQKVRYVMDPALEKQMGGKADLPSLIDLLVRNENEALKKVHLKAEKQKIVSIGKQAIFTSLRKVSDPIKRQKLWNECRGFFIQPSQESLDKMGVPMTQEDSILLLKELAGKEQKKLQDLIGKIPPGTDFIFAEGLQKGIVELDKKIAGATLIDKKYLPEKVYRAEMDQDMQQEVEQEKEMEEEQEVEVEQEQEQEQEQVSKEGKFSDESWHKFSVDNVKNLVDFHLSQVTQDTSSFKKLGKYEAAFDDNLFLTWNLTTDSSVNLLETKVREYVNERGLKCIETTNIYPDEQIVTTKTIHSSKVTSTDTETLHIKTPVKDTFQLRNRIFRFILTVDNRVSPSQVKVVLGSLKDFDHVFEKLDDKPDSDIDFYLYDLNMDDLNGRNTKWKEYSPETQEAIGRAIAQVKLFAGEVDLLKPPAGAPLIRQEHQAFEKWLSDAMHKGANPVELEKKLKNYLSKYRPSMLEQYPQSSMAEAFRKAKARNIVT